MLNIKLSGRIDAQATYSDTSLNQLHDWFMNVQEVETTYQNSDWAKKTQNALGFIKDTQTSVELALDFESLKLKWKGYRILCSMVTQMAIYQTVDRFPKLTPKRKKDLFDGRGRILGMLEAFSSIVLQNRQFNREEDFYREVQKVIPKPYQLELDYFPVCAYWVQSCERDYNVVTELIKICQKTAPLMISNDVIFWEQLKMVAAKENLKPLVEAYEQLCEFFRNGFPYDRLFEYYKLVSRISNQLKIFGDHEEKVLLGLARVQTRDSNSMAQAQSKKKGGQLTASELPMKVLQDKANLVMNYAEELLQARSLGPVIEFYPHVRAEKEQIERIALLLSDIVSLDYVIKLSHLVHQLGYDLYRTDLPVVIKHKVTHFAEFLHEEITEITAPMMTPKEPVPERETVREWDSNLSTTLQKHMSLNKPLDVQLRAASEHLDSLKDANVGKEERVHRYSLSVLKAIRDYEHSHILPTTTLRLHESPTTWQAILRTTERELATIDKRNAAILIDSLSRTQRVIRNIPVFDRIYYILNTIRGSKRTYILQKVNSRLKEFQKTNNGHEFHTLNNILKKITDNANSREILNDVWRRSFLPDLQVLPTELAMILGDMFDDYSRAILIKRLKPECQEFLKQNLHALLRKDFLSEEVIRNHKELLEDAYLRLDQEKSTLKLSNGSTRFGLLSF
ncbi:uncharacterized protein PGTG_19904 [Puccinia graminis f. sp. tritici CRL 75-36-700-3]|uniref:Uncharacterized protein n=1 Tax=Puccinia graminis f. sp. tritici (strain CRL 75-36-700-3 / race SCCL) TaxID=418459 RepID=E3LBG6_PUCGT|nr:uncharacterized protein PGTG_19904 [Puccinia graminis f. sp. tritici CRL 75-36-700-3]EFP93891.2 hypothetical protein PGTG_19904 [Puccinia graminis f. sp. tritici CRL 75-36-700-3]